MTNTAEFNIAEIYANAHNFKMVGVKSPYHNTLLNIHVDVDALDESFTPFAKEGNVKSIIKINVCDSNSTTVNQDCWAETTLTAALSQHPHFISLVKQALEVLKIENNKSLKSQNLKDLKFTSDSI